MCGGLLLCGVGVLCENCIVDAMQFVSTPFYVAALCCVVWGWGFVVFYSLFLVFFVCKYLLLCCLVKGTRWMPWQLKPMKDV